MIHSANGNGMLNLFLERECIIITFVKKEDKLKPITSDGRALLLKNRSFFHFLFGLGFVVCHNMCR